MSIWLAEIKELKKVYESIQGNLPALEKELERLIATDDENMLLVYSRRCLEVIVTDLCEHELKRHRGTEPLQRIIDKLNKEEKVPHNIIVSMLNVNSMSTFGAHPKEFELKQVKPVLINLTTIIEWYISYLNPVEGLQSTKEKHTSEPSRGIHRKVHPKRITKIRLLGVGVLVLLTLIFASLIFLDIIKVGTPLKANIIDSIVILPFDNFTGDEDLEDLFSGMQSMLISDMQRLSNLRIPCWTSSNAYKDANMTVTQIASNLDTKAAIEMGIFSFGDSIGMQCKLISTVPEEKQIWDKVYKVAKSEIYNLNNQVTKDIAEEVKVKLTPQEENLLAESRIVDPEAMDAYAMGQHFLEQASNESLEKASEFFNIAIKNDSSWAAPYAGVALVWVFKQQLTSVPPSVATPIIKENFEKALALDPNSANSHYVNALIAVWTDWDWEKGEKEFLRSLDLNPNDALCRVYYAHFLMIMKRKEEAIKQANMTLKLDPMRPLVLALYSTVMRVYSDYESAITQLEKALSIEPEHPLAKNSLRVAYRHTGNYEKWFELWKNGVRLDQESIASVEKAFREQGYMAAVEEMIKIGENGGRIGGLSGLYIQLENYEKAMDYFEQAYEEHSPGMPYLSIFNIKKEDLSDNARYIELMKKMNLPLE